MSEVSTLTSFKDGLDEKRHHLVGRKRGVDAQRLSLMDDWEVENVLAKAKRFSEALEVLGVGRKTFMAWLDKDPERKKWMGRKRSIPLWEY